MESELSQFHSELNNEIDGSEPLNGSQSSSSQIMKISRKHPRVIRSDSDETSSEDDMLLSELKSDKTAFKLKRRSRKRSKSSSSSSSCHKNIAQSKRRSRIIEPDSDEFPEDYDKLSDGKEQEVIEVIESDDEKTEDVDDPDESESSSGSDNENNESITSGDWETGSEELVCDYESYYGENRRIPLIDLLEQYEESMASRRNYDGPIFDLSRRDTVRGTNREREYEQQKALTVAKLEEIQEVLNSRPKEDELAEQPDELEIPLKAHQLHGLRFMIWRESCANPGGIIADDMGLGKTGLTIALIARQKQFQELRRALRPRDNHKGGTLIISAASVLGHWEQEFDKFCKRDVLNVYSFHGANREKRSEKLFNYDVVITSYKLVSISNSLFEIDWERIIIDEGHIIRNVDTDQAKACFKLVAKYRWVLTGTPIQNKGEDLFSLIKFMRFSPFDNFYNWKEFIQPPEETPFLKEPKERLVLILQNVMLRREKLKVEEAGYIEKLPEKKIVELPIELSNREQAVYDFFNTFSQAIYFRFLELKGELYTHDTAISSLHQKFDDILQRCNVKQYHLYVLLLRLRQIVCHPALILHELSEECDFIDFSATEGNTDNNYWSNTGRSIKLPDLDLKAELTTLLNEANFVDDDDDDEVDYEAINSSKLFSRKNPVFDVAQPSAKMVALLPLVKEKLKNNEKVIIVSTFLKFLNAIAEMLKDNDIDYKMFTGKTSIPNRNIIVNDLNAPDTDTKVLLLSMNAGAVGLNLTGANNMFIVDLHWNPQQERQVMDRIHRIGQIKSVTIVKFICLGTVEEKILQIQSRKVEIAENILDGENQKFLSNLTIEDMKKLFGLQTLDQ